MLTDVPLELRERRQWIVWRYEAREDSAKLTKVPYQPLTGRLASVTEPSHWASFDEACAAVSRGYSGIGYVFSKDDPYAGIDLDDSEGDEAILNAQIQIYNALESYTESSPSGKGCHIIARGSVAAGIRFSKVEVYSSERYFTITGNVIRNLPITDCSPTISLLYDEMRERQGKTSVIGAQATGTLVAEMTDQEVYDQAARSANGHKFETLWAGDWESVTDDNGRHYPSQSEADQALVNILQFHSRNRLQIERLFLYAPLAREKHRKRNALIQYMINKSFDREIPPMNFDVAISNLNAEKAILAAPRLPKAPIAPDTPRPDADVYTMPPESGLLAALTDFYYRSAPRPVREIALATAVATMAAISGNAYNIEGAGLNMYLMVLAPTGIGKEAMSSGVNKLVATMTRHAVGSIGNFIGPSEISSAPALYKAFKNSSSIVCILGEMGYRLEAMTDIRQSAQVTLKRAFLDIYGKSGAGNAVGGMQYADSAKNQESLKSPALTLLCESTQEILLSRLSETMISDGLLPRFLVFDYTGPRVPSNPGSHLVELDDNLRGAIAHFVTGALTSMERRVVTEVALSEAASIMDKDFDRFCDGKINAAGKDAIRQLWSRAHLKVRKLAALCAVGANHLQPVISKANYVWAKAIVVHDVVGTIARFDKGEIGVATQATTHSELMRATAMHLIEYIERKIDTNPFNKNYRVRADHHAHAIVNRQFLLLKAQQSGPYRRMKFGSFSANLELALKELIGAGYLEDVNTNEPGYIKTFGAVKDKRHTANYYWVPSLLMLKERFEDDGSVKDDDDG